MLLDSLLKAISSVQYTTVHVSTSEYTQYSQNRPDRLTYNAISIFVLSYISGLPQAFEFTSRE
jgi:hypothetical protein